MQVSRLRAGVRLSGSRSALVVVVVLGATLLAACASSEPPEVVPRPVEGLTATLDDRVTKLPGDRIAWATDWTLCWRAYPNADAYELKALTGEGEARGEPLRQQETCFRIEAAAGENAASQGLRSRDAQLVLQQGQLAYTVRAVLDGNRVTEWSSPVAVGEARPQP